MPDGLNRTGDFKDGNPVPATDPKFDSNPITQTPDPKNFGNVEPVADATKGNNGTPITLPHKFGNVIP